MARSEGWVLALLVVFAFILMWVKWRWPSPATPRTHLKPTPRPVKPRTPDDCPACRAAQPSPPPASTPLKPYSQVKDPRGRKKRIATAGYACPNSDCRYYGITNDQIHALVGCGGHGRQEYIRASRLKCQACGTKFSSRYGTVLYRLKTASQRVGEVLSALAEGLSVGAAVRVFGHGEFTIRSWLTRAGLHAASLHERLFQNLKFLHIQLDELCTKTRRGADALWVWFAVDARTKVIAVLKVGPRTHPIAHTVVHALVKVLAPDCLPIFTSDGLKLCFYGSLPTSAVGLRPWGSLHTSGKTAPGFSTDNSPNITGADASSALSAAPCLARSIN